MDEAPASKRRRVLSFCPNTVAYTTFSLKYVSFLLPALLKAANADKTVQIEKIVRYEVDMALVLSACEFKWSRALKQKLEGSKMAKNKLLSFECRSQIALGAHFGCLKRSGEHFKTLPVIPRPIVVMKVTRPRKASHRYIKRRVARKDKQLAYRIRILRRILPGGGEMGVFELLSEVQSYLACLQLQVDVLRSLVDAQC